MEDHPRRVLFALSTPLSAWVILVGWFIVSPIFFGQFTIIEKLLTEVSCQHLGYFQGHLTYQFVGQAISSPEGVVTGSEKVQSKESNFVIVHKKGSGKPGAEMVKIPDPDNDGVCHVLELQLDWCCETDLVTFS